MILTQLKAYGFAALALALGVLLAMQTWRLHTEQLAHRDLIAQVAQADLARAAVAARVEKENQARKDAQNADVHAAQTDRAQASQRDQAALAGLAAERDRLRASLNIALNTIRSCDVPSAAADARANRGATIAAVFDELERAGAEASRAADGHAADALMYQRAWPR